MIVFKGPLFCIRETEYEYPMTTVSRAPPLPPPPHNCHCHDPVYEDIIQQQCSSDASLAFSLAGPTPSPASPTTDPHPLGNGIPVYSVSSIHGCQIGRKSRGMTLLDVMTQRYNIHYIASSVVFLHRTSNVSLRMKTQVMMATSGKLMVQFMEHYICQGNTKCVSRGVILPHSLYTSGSG